MFWAAGEMAGWAVRDWRNDWKLRNGNCIGFIEQFIREVNGGSAEL